MLDAEIILSRLEINMNQIKSYAEIILSREINIDKKIRKGLFGSFALNEQSKKSDIDLLVVFMPGKKTFDNYMGLKFFLEDLLEKPIDLVIAEAVKPALKDHIEGSVIFAQGV
jgi:predicted nucleotidyltransferase